MATYQGLYLPKLDQDKNNVPASREGLWAARDERLVTDLAKGIHIGEAPADGRRGPAISSVPDVYARPLLFQSAFRNAAHPAHRDCVQEWRGLLSLLALYEVKPGLKKGLRLVPVGFEGYESNPLVRAVQQLQPPSVQLEDAQAYEWSRLLLVQFNGITLGAFSPATLVFTAAEYDLRTNDGFLPHIGQFCDERGRLRPPLATRDPDDLLAVGEWLLWLKPEGQQEPSGLSRAIGFNPAASKVREAIFDELQKWVADIRQELGQPADLNARKYRPGTAAEAVVPPGAAWLENYAVYRLLLTPLRLDEKYVGRAESDRALLLGQRARPPYKHVVVVQPEPGMDRRLRLWNDVKLETLGNNPFEALFPGDHGPTLGGYDIKDGDEPGIWIRPELFFLTATLTKAPGSGAFLHEHEARANGERGSQFVLPLRASILDYFTVEEITEKLRPGYKTEGNGQDIKSVTFSFSLPLRGSGTPATVSKKYVLSNPGPGEGTLEERAVPVLELFPNYVGDFWGRYYLLSSDTEKTIAVPVSRAIDPSQFVAGPTRQHRLDNLRAEITRIGGENSFPEAVALRERGGSGEELGLILLNRYVGSAGDELRDKQFNPSASAVFGVDFGTSNTNVFIKEGEEAKELKYPFDKHLRVLTAAGDQARCALNNAFFVPEEFKADAPQSGQQQTPKQEKDEKRRKSFPVPTALRIFDPGVRESLLLDYFPYFPEPGSYLYPANVQVNLKWQEETVGSTRNYLESLVFLLLLEAVRRRLGKVEFRFTYPKAFDDRRRDQYRFEWEEILKGVIPGGPSKLGAGPAFIGGQWEENGSTQQLTAYALGTGVGRFIFDTKVHSFTEGEAAGEFFSKTGGAALANGAVCIDIGGGTTDYSLLFGGKSLYDTSVLLAGGQVAQLLRENRTLANRLFEDDKQALQSLPAGQLSVGEVLRKLREKEATESAYGSSFNLILKDKHDDVRTSLARNLNESNGLMIPLLQSLLLEFGALAFYAGHLVLALNKSEPVGGRLAAKVKDYGIGLYWGGNASKMLEWMPGHSRTADSAALKMMTYLFGAVITNKTLPEAEKFTISSPTLLAQKQSPDSHKQEAAGGAVYKSTFEAEDPEEQFQGFDLDTPSAAGPANPLLFDLDELPAEEDGNEGVVLGERVRVNGHEYPSHHFFAKREVDELLKKPLDINTNLEELERLLRGVNALGGLNKDKKEHIGLSERLKLDIRNHVHELYASQSRLAEDERVLEPTLIVEVRYLLKRIRENNL